MLRGYAIYSWYLQPLIDIKISQDVNGHDDERSVSII